MNKQKIGLISIIKAAVTGEKADLPADFDFDPIWNIAKKHQITSIVYYGASNCGVDQDAPVMKRLFESLFECIALTGKQNLEISRICKAFSEGGIDHLLLKGALLREMYPEAEMRLMGDVDILIKSEQYDGIRQIMLDLGFEEKKESDHEYIWKKAQIVIELHKRLVPSYNKDYYSYYGDGWRLAIPSEDAPYRYKMSAEDQMIYLFTHFAKHYRCGGIGIKHITDIYVYRRSAGDLNEEYIERELKKLKLYEFYTNVIKTVDVWFCGAEPDEKTELITDVVFESGVFGTASKKTVARTVILKNDGSHIKSEKLQYVLRMAFPSLESMKMKYNFLKKMPLLLPVAWGYRLFKIVFFKRKKTKRFLNNVKNISAQDISDYKTSLHYVGLDFNFEE